MVETAHAPCREFGLSDVVGHNRGHCHFRSGREPRDEAYVDGSFSVSKGSPFSAHISETWRSKRYLEFETLSVRQPVNLL